METATESLRLEVGKFKAWALAFPGEKSGEWELDYPVWEDLYQAALPIVHANPEWTIEQIDLLLYSIARDNEVRLLVNEVPADRLLQLARVALASGESDAKWQLVERLTTLPWNREMEELLLGFAADNHEYVRRRALRALAEFNSGHTEHLAEQAWATGDEYQRIAALHAFYRVKSPLLQNYLSLAIQDGREYLVKNVEKIRDGKSEH